MSERKIRALRELTASIRANTQKVQQRIAVNTHHTPDRSVVMTASKYRVALDRLAKEQLAFRFSRAYVEYIHDDIVALAVEPGDEPVSPKEYRNPDLIESACARPFHTAFGEDVFPTLFEKAAAFFHALVCNHCFGNGNKRTALMALDLFMMANDMFFSLDNRESYELAVSTASHNVDGRRAEDVMADIASILEENSIPLIDLLNPEARDAIGDDLYDGILAAAENIKAHPLNRDVNEDAERGG